MVNNKHINANRQQMFQINRNAFKDLNDRKIANTHFRLGSKIHITDFYYAKPYFQESKYVLPFAKKISDSIKKTITENKIKNLTIIGYGLYSELLVSYVKNMLLSIFRKIRIRINTNTVSDTEIRVFNKPDNTIYENVVIIVPIATTFSTSIKIERIVRQKYSEQDNNEKELKILQPYYNILAVVDQEAFEKCKKVENELPDIFLTYGWKKIDKDNQIITTKGIDNDSTVEQSYIIAMSTSWQYIDECTKCFPDRIPKKENCSRGCLTCKEYCAKEEEPLFYTDNTSLTPELILTLPKSRNIKNKNNLILENDSIRYGHIERNKNHYNFYFNDYAVWSKNAGKVKSWLKKNHKIKNIDTITSYVIFSPSHFSNAEFVEMVNDVVFKNQATIIHYDPDIKNPQIFDHYYNLSKYQSQKNVKFYFVDDVVTSGSTLYEANKILKRIINSKAKFESCFFFINRSGYYEDIDITGICKNINAFADLHLPYIKSQDNICPLCYETEKYKKLIENSYLTRVKLYFLEKRDKLERLGITDIKELQNDKKTNILLRVEANHRIYALFERKKDNGFKEDNRAPLKIKSTKKVS